MSKRIRAAGLMFLTTVIWGFAMATQRHGDQFLSPFTFNGCRAVLGGLCLLPLMLREHHAAESKTLLLTKRDIKAGCMAGVMLFSASFLQQAGVGDAGAGKAGFLTAMYVVLVPVLGVFLGKKTRLFTWLALLIALPALYLLCVTPGAAFTLLPADGLVLMGAFFWAGHILVTDHYASRLSPLKLCTVQFFAAGALNMICALIFERDTITLANLQNALWAVAYCGIFSTGVGYLFQTIGQRDCPPAFAALILCLESVFCVIAGALMLGEEMTGRGYLGCILMLIAVLVAQAGDLIALRKEKCHV